MNVSYLDHLNIQNIHHDSIDHLCKRSYIYKNIYIFFFSWKNAPLDILCLCHGKLIRIFQYSYFMIQENKVTLKGFA